MFALCFLSKAVCSAACHWFGVVACKIHAVKMSFALPVCCTGPAVLLLGLTLFLTQVQKLDGAEQGSMTGEFSSSSSFNLHDLKSCLWSAQTTCCKCDLNMLNFIVEFCESLVYVSHRNTTPVVLLEITRSICRTSLGRYVFK